MAVAHTLLQADGNAVRSAMSQLDMDGNASFASGTVVGLTIVTKLAGVDVDASTAESYTSGAAQTPKELMDAVVADFEGKLTGANVRYSHNVDDFYVLHVEAVPGVADDVTISVPVFTPA